MNADLCHPRSSAANKIRLIYPEADIYYSRDVFIDG